MSVSRAFGQQTTEPRTHPLAVIKYDRDMALSIPMCPLSLNGRKPDREGGCGRLRPQLPLVVTAVYRQI